VGALTESVTVTAEITPVQNASAEPSGLVSGKQTAQLLTIGRDITSLVRILPGVVGGGGSDSLGGVRAPYD